MKLNSIFYLFPLMLFSSLCVKAGVSDGCINIAEEQLYIKDCCNSTLESCVSKKPGCEIAVRLHKFTKWVDTVDGVKPCSTVVSAVKDRYESLTNVITNQIDLNGVSFAGSPKAKVTIIMYVSATCPLCKKIYKELYASVTKGELLNKAKLGMKVISAKPWDLALVAANHFGKQSRLMLSLNDVNGRVTLDTIIQKAKKLGIPTDKFNQVINDPATKDAAYESSDESKLNDVVYTPTFFINNKRYHSFKNPEWVIDAVIFEFNKLSSAKAVPHK